MAFLLKKHAENYTCLSTDVKTTVGIQVGSKLEELDTGLKYVFDGTAWQPDLVSAKLTAGTAKIGDVSIIGTPIVAAGRRTDAVLGEDKIMTTTGFKQLAITNDGPAELIVAIDESAITGTMLIHILDGEAYEGNISGTAIHYTILNDACSFRYVLM